MGDEDTTDPGLETSVTGKGVFPHQAARTLLNPLRGLVLSSSRLIKRLQLRDDMTVLEVGPGPGYFSPDVAAAIPAGKLLLFDIQREMLEMAAARLRKAGHANFEAFCGDAKTLPFEDSSVDVTFMVTVLGEVEEKASCLSEIHRVLRPGGLLSVTEMRGDPDYLRLDEVEQLTARAGFEHERTVRGFLHYTFAARRPA